MQLPTFNPKRAFPCETDDGAEILVNKIDSEISGPGRVLMFDEIGNLYEANPAALTITLKIAAEKPADVPVETPDDKPASPAETKADAETGAAA